MNIQLNIYQYSIYYMNIQEIMNIQLSRDMNIHFHLFKQIYFNSVSPMNNVNNLGQTS